MTKEVNMEGFLFEVRLKLMETTLYVVEVGRSRLLLLRGDKLRVCTRAQTNASTTLETS